MADFPVSISASSNKIVNLQDFWHIKRKCFSWITSIIPHCKGAFETPCVYVRACVCVCVCVCVLGLVYRQNKKEKRIFSSTSELYP